MCKHFLYLFSHTSCLLHLCQLTVHTSVVMRWWNWTHWQLNGSAGFINYGNIWTRWWEDPTWLHLLTKMLTPWGLWAYNLAVYCTWFGVLVFLVFLVLLWDSSTYCIWNASLRGLSKVMYNPKLPVCCDASSRDEGTGGTGSWEEVPASLLPRKCNKMYEYHNTWYADLTIWLFVYTKDCCCLVLVFLLLTLSFKWVARACMPLKHEYNMLLQ